MELWELVARESIRDLVARFNANGDSGRFEQMMKVFADDAVMEAVGTDGSVRRFEGVESVATIFTATKANWDVDVKPVATNHHVRHLTATHQIDLVDETPRGAVATSLSSWAMAWITGVAISTTTASVTTVGSSRIVGRSPMGGLTPARRSDSPSNGQVTGHQLVTCDGGSPTAGAHPSRQPAWSRSHQYRMSRCRWPRARGCREPFALRAASDSPTRLWCSGPPPDRPQGLSREAGSSRFEWKESAPMALASFVMSDTTVVSRSSTTVGGRFSTADRTGGSGSASTRRQHPANRRRTR